MEEGSASTPEGYVTPTKEPLNVTPPIPAAEEIIQEASIVDSEVLREVESTGDPDNLEDLLPALNKRRNSGGAKGGGGGEEASSPPLTEETQQVDPTTARGGGGGAAITEGDEGGKFDKIQSDAAGKLSVRDLHTDENSPADIALKAASTKQAKKRSSATKRMSSKGGSSFGVTGNGELDGSDDDDEIVPEGNEITEEHAQYGEDGWSEATAALRSVATTRTTYHLS